MTEFIAGMFGVSILVLAWIAVRIGEKVTSLERRLRRLEITYSENPGRVIGSQPESAKKHEPAPPKLSGS